MRSLPLGTVALCAFGPYWKVIKGSVAGEEDALCFGAFFSPQTSQKFEAIRRGTVGVAEGGVTLAPASRSRASPSLPHVVGLPSSCPSPVGPA